MNLWLIIAVVKLKAEKKIQAWTGFKPMTHDPLIYSFTFFTFYGYITNSQCDQLPDGLTTWLVEHYLFTENGSVHTLSTPSTQNTITCGVQAQEQTPYPGTGTVPCAQILVEVLLPAKRPAIVKLPSLNISRELREQNDSILQCIWTIITSIMLLCRLHLSGSVHKHNHRRPYDQHNHNHKSTIFLWLCLWL